jgi:hypothetical protein
LGVKLMPAAEGARSGSKGWSAGDVEARRHHDALSWRAIRRKVQRYSPGFDQ